MKINHVFLVKSNPIFRKSKTLLDLNFNYYAKVIANCGENREIYKVAVLAESLEEVSSLLEKYFEGEKPEIKFIKPVKNEEAENKMD
jgi:hypothetical protein